MISSKLATLHELDTVYGAEDMYLLLEINSVDIHNQNAVRRRAASKG